jgi:hypothetical protein
MSKQWQDFWTFIFLGVSSIYLFVKSFRITFLKNDLPRSAQNAWGGVFFVFGILIPFGILPFAFIPGFFSELWQVLIRPFR